MNSVCTRDRCSPHILLADEINRASPRTQSALLESMAEGQVSIDGTLMKLAALFFVIATQNPVESRGTYPLPEAQMDRFAMQLKLGYVSREDEVAVLSDQHQEVHPVENVTPCASLEDCLELRKIVSGIHVATVLKQYMVDLAGQTRERSGVLLGASPRASIAMMKAAQALAVFDNLEFITADHIQQVAVAVMAHRLVLDASAVYAGLTPSAVVQEILDTIPVPA